MPVCMHMYFTPMQNIRDMLHPAYLSLDFTMCSMHIHMNHVYMVFSIEMNPTNLLVFGVIVKPKFSLVTCLIRCHLSVLLNNHWEFTKNLPTLVLNCRYDGG